MARVTVEDCLKYVDNYFQLVELASKKAVAIMSKGGVNMTNSKGEKEKLAVVALREISLGNIK